MKRYSCSLCGYIYEPSKGDPAGGILSGTDFENLPEDWTCPLCRTSKDKFTEIEIADNLCEKNNHKAEEQIAPKKDTRFEGEINNHDYDNNKQFD